MITKRTLEQLDRLILRRMKRELLRLCDESPDGKISTKTIRRVLGEDDA